MERVFHRPVVLPVTQPSVSIQWREHKALTVTSGLASSFLHPPSCSLHTGSPMPRPNQCLWLNRYKSIFSDWPTQVTVYFIKTEWLRWPTLTAVSKHNVYLQDNIVGRVRPGFRRYCLYKTVQLLNSVFTHNLWLYRKTTKREPETKFTWKSAIKTPEMLYTHGTSGWLP